MSQAAGSAIRAYVAGITGLSALAAGLVEQGAGAEGGGEAAAESGGVDEIGEGRHGGEHSGVGIPPEFFHAGGEIDVEVAGTDQLRHAEEAVGASDAAVFEATVGGGADGKGGEHVVDQDGAGLDAAGDGGGGGGFAPDTGGEAEGTR